MVCASICCKGAAHRAGIIRDTQTGVNHRHVARHRPLVGGAGESLLTVLKVHRRGSSPDVP
jgi:hypothetical protein